MKGSTRVAIPILFFCLLVGFYGNCAPKVVPINHCEPYEKKEEYPYIVTVTEQNGRSFATLHRNDCKLLQGKEVCKYWQFDFWSFHDLPAALQQLVNYGNGSTWCENESWTNNEKSEMATEILRFVEERKTRRFEGEE